MPGQPAAGFLRCVTDPCGRRLDGIDEVGGQAQEVSGQDLETSFEVWVRTPRKPTSW